ncbi:MAG: PQQ-binding-like beta-propeller repeat protein [Phycisphaerales bacterium]|nr:PQQ-binding-like beta-propeller repeat protein [Phycisphaerales bacterium]
MCSVSSLLALYLAMALSIGPGVDSQLDPAARNEARVEALERQMPLGPRTAKALGMRVQWRKPIDIDSIRGMHTSHGAVFLVNTNNEVSMLDLKDGRHKWKSFGGSASDLILDVAYLPEKNKVLVIRSNSILTLAGGTGLPILNKATQSSVQPLDWLAATSGVMFHDAYIYGGLAGEVAWQTYDLGFSSKANRIGRRIAEPPVLAGEIVVATSQDGTLAALDATSGTLLWTKKLLDQVSGEPATSNRLLFVASHDQHLRAMDARDGRGRWSRLFEQPLQSGPTFIGDAVYQQVPQTGLVKLEALPPSAPEGIITWTAEDVSGDVIATIGELLLTFDPSNNELQTVSARTGAVDATGRINKLSLMNAEANNLLLLGGSGELECLGTTGSH